MDLEAQANAYRAFFRAVWTQPWFAGAYFWKWHPVAKATAPASNILFTPQGKPALAVLTDYYAAAEVAKSVSTLHSEVLGQRYD